MKLVRLNESDNTSPVEQHPRAFKMIKSDDFNYRVLRGKELSDGTGPFVAYKTYQGHDSYVYRGMPQYDDYWNVANVIYLYGLDDKNIITHIVANGETHHNMGGSGNHYLAKYEVNEYEFTDSSEAEEFFLVLKRNPKKSYKPSGAKIYTKLYDDRPKSRYLGRLSQEVNGVL